MQVKLSLSREEAVLTLAYLRMLQDNMRPYMEIDCPKKKVYESRSIDIEKLKMKIAGQVAKADQKGKV